MNELQTVKQIVASLDNDIEEMNSAIDHITGQLQAYKQSGNDRIKVTPEGILELIRLFRNQISYSRDALKALSSLVDGIQQNASNDRLLFLKLLGLMPDASSQEVTDAVDDIAPLFAKYRRDKRGT